jgi:hypothetical protein
MTSRCFQSWFPRLLLVMGLGSGVIFLASWGLELRQQRQMQRQAQQAWERVQQLEQNRDYNQCRIQANAIAPNSPFYDQAQQSQYRCQLAQGQALAQDNQGAEAIALLMALPPEAADYDQAQILVQELSEQILDQAEATFQAGDLAEAKVILSRLPDGTPIKEVAQQFELDWEMEWQENEVLVETAEQALEKGRWLDAKETLQQVSSNVYWQGKVEPLLAKAEIGIEEVLRYEWELQQQQQQVQQPQPIPTVSFNERFQSLYETYVDEGLDEWEAGLLACESLEGTVVDEGPEAACEP